MYELITHVRWRTRPHHFVLSFQFGFGRLPPSATRFTECGIIRCHWKHFHLGIWTVTAGRAAQTIVSGAIYILSRCIFDSGILTQPQKEEGNKMTKNLIERPIFFCEKIGRNAKVKIIYTIPIPEEKIRILHHISCKDISECPISEVSGNITKPNYKKCLFNLHLKNIGIIKWFIWKFGLFNINR